MEAYNSLRNSLATLLLRANHGNGQNIGTEGVGFVRESRHQGFSPSSGSLIAWRFYRHPHITPESSCVAYAPSPREEGDDGSYGDRRRIWHLPG